MASLLENERLRAGTVLARRTAMKTFMLLTSIAIALAGCVSQTEEENVDEQSEALRNVGSGGATDSPEGCLASQQACYKTCGSNSSCYRYCDLVYTKCRGLPEPELMLLR